MAAGNSRTRARYASNVLIRSPSRQLGEIGAGRIPLGQILGVRQVAAGVLLLELLEPLEEPRSLAAANRDLRRLEELAKLGSGGIDDRGRQHAVGDAGEDVVFDKVSRAAPGATAKLRAAVVAPLGAALEVRLAAHSGAALAVEETAQDVVAERTGLVADPGAGGDSRRRPTIFGLGQDRLVPPGPLVAPALLDHEAEVEAARRQMSLTASRVHGPSWGTPSRFTLDRVICCYPDMAALVGRSATLARRRYGLVYPLDSWLGRVGVALMNAGFRLSRSPFRTYVHRTAEVDAILAARGLVKVLHSTTLIWQLAVYERPAT